MKKIMFLCYSLLTLLFIVLTLIEFIKYLNFESTFLGLLYLLSNLFIIFILINSVINFYKANYKIRVSKNLIVIVIGVLASYLLGYIIPELLNYTDSSFLFASEIYIYSKILKPIIYVFLGIFSIVEVMYKNELSVFKNIK